MRSGSSQTSRRRSPRYTPIWDMTAPAGSRWQTSMGPARCLSSRTPTATRWVVGRWTFRRRHRRGEADVHRARVAGSRRRGGRPGRARTAGPGIWLPTMRLETGDRQPGAIRLYSAAAIATSRRLDRTSHGTTASVSRSRCADGARLTHASRPSPARPLSKQTYKAQALLLREELLAVQQRLRQASFPSSCCSPASTAPARARPSTCCTSGWTRAGCTRTPMASPPTRSASGRNTGASGATCRRRASRHPHQRLYAAPIDRRAHRTNGHGVPARAAGNRAPRATAHQRRRADPEVHDAPRARHAAGRLKALERDPLTRWRATAEQWRQARSYDELVEAEATAVRFTDASQAPWTLVDGSDEPHRSLVVARAIRDRVTRRWTRRSRAGGREGRRRGQSAAARVQRPRPRARGERDRKRSPTWTCRAPWGKRPTTWRSLGPRAA